MTYGTNMQGVADIHTLASGYLDDRSTTIHVYGKWMELDKGDENEKWVYVASLHILRKNGVVQSQEKELKDNLIWHVYEAFGVKYWKIEAGDLEILTKIDGRRILIPAVGMRLRRH